MRFLKQVCIFTFAAVLLLLQSGLPNSAERTTIDDAQDPAVSGLTDRKQQRLAGFRASRIPENYAGGIFPPAEYWVSTAGRVAGKFEGCRPAAIWIVGLYQENGITQLEFPRPPDRAAHLLRHVRFTAADLHEAYLNAFDAAGFRVYLQVEPGAADAATLIDLVLRRYGHHGCVAGVGIDVEWLDPERHPGGRKVGDGEARRWERRVRRHGRAYTLFLKHWDPRWMPPRHRGSILFVDDSLDHLSLDDMVNEFARWGDHFSPNPVAFQVGYPQDRPWWSALADAPATIGRRLFEDVPNTRGVFWVDFTLEEIHPSGLKEVEGD